MVEIHLMEDEDDESPAGESDAQDHVDPQVFGLTRDVDRLRAMVARLEEKLDKHKRKTAKWKSAAKAERTRAAKVEAALRRATSPRPREDGDVPVPPPAE